MAFRRVGILSIGEMGFHWAKLLSSRGVEVLTCSKGRSEVSRKRAENAGVRSVASLAQLVSQSDLIVSLVIPSAAKRVAAKMAKTILKVGKEGFIFLDANATSPMTARAMGQEFSGTRASFIDGSIIGSATKLNQGAVVYVSGPEAEHAKALEQFGLSVRVLGHEVGQASAFKIVYAGLTKGLQGLLVELLVGARKLGLLNEILGRYEESFPGLVQKVGQSIVGLPIHASRRAEEMVELRKTFRSHGLKSVVAPSVEKILKAMGDLRVGSASETGTRKGSLAETVELFFQRGLLQDQRVAGMVEEAVRIESNTVRGE